MKVVINKCYGGFGLSPEAQLWLLEKGYDGKGFKTPIDDWYGGRRSPDEDLKKWRTYLAKKPNSKRDCLFVTVFSPDEKFVLNESDIERNDPLLVECVETLGEKANGSCAKLSIVEVPDGIDWEIDEYDGNESVEQKHLSWR